MTMTGKSKKVVTSITGIAFIASILGVLAVTTFDLQEAIATHCDGSCYGREGSSVTTIGNKFTTKVTDMSMTNNCTYHATATQWVKLPDSNWVETGFTIGQFLNDTCAGNDEYSYHVYKIPGFSYQDNRDADVNVGDTRTYEVSDLDGDKIWDFIDDGTTVESVYTTYSQGIGQYVGAETTHHSPTIPNTHFGDIQYADTNGSWNYWSAATPQENSPLWFKDCSPSARHVHAGTSGSETCSEY